MEDRGLPADPDLRDLARGYLETQRNLWPELVANGVLPEPTDEVLAEMLEDFKARHRGGPVAAVQPPRGCSAVGASYSRYSCDNSNPRSISDQVHNELRKARAENRFIPWQHVFADYSASGLDSSRQSYNALKKFLAAPGCPVETVYIDDFTRASRDEIEWWKLARLLKRLKRRLIGASDGFDLDSEHADLMVGVYGIISRQFVKSLQQKVRRGMRGAARRGTALGKPALGYRLCPATTASGDPLLGKDGVPLNTYCIDPANSEFVKMAFCLYGEERLSCYKIARRFNQMKVDGWDGWSDSSIRKILQNPLYVGQSIYGRTRSERDPESGRIEFVETAPEEWVVTPMPDLRIISDELWETVRERLDQRHRRTGPRVSRNQHSASTLFSGTLVCGYCGHEITLARSGKYKVMHCLNGTLQTHGCLLRCTKSVGIVEECLLAYIQGRIFTREAMEKLVADANRFLAEEAAKPQLDLGPMKAEASQLDAKIRKLVRQVEDEPDEQLCRGYHQRIKALEQARQEVTARIHEVEVRARRSLKPLSLEDIESRLSGLRGLLNQSTPAAAEALRALTGPITITQEPMPNNGRGGRWLASFQPNLVRLLAKTVGGKHYPDCDTLVYLSTAIWTNAPSVTVEIDAIPRWTKVFPAVAELEAKGASINAIAQALGIPWNLARQAIRFLHSGKLARFQAQSPPRAENGRAGDRLPKYIAHAEHIAALRDGQGLTWRVIAKRLGIGAATAARAYWHHHRQAVLEATRAGHRPPGPRYSHLGFEKYAEIRRLGTAGKSINEIAAALGCGRSTVYRALRSE